MILREQVMGVVTSEPSMEDILSSIKRIIADGSDRAAPARPMRRKAVDRFEGESAATGYDSAVTADQDGPVPSSAALNKEPAILELTDMVEESAAMTDVTPQKPAVSQVQTDAPVQDDLILSDISAQAARQSLSELSSLLVRPAEGEANTLDGLVREMLRPMMKEWLEARLPDLVQSMVKKEIDRIVGRLG